MIPGMKTIALLVVLPVLLLLVACSESAPTPTDSTEGSDGEPRRLPATLDRLVLAEDLAIITPVRFGHALHVDAAAMGREVACDECHHALRDDAARVPTPCAACHVPEDEAHDETDPPDI